MGRPGRTASSPTGLCSAQSARPAARGTDVVSEEQGRVEATASIDIDRPIDDVFRFITDVGRMPVWVTGVTRARLASAAMGRDTHFVLSYLGGWRETELAVVVTAYDPPRSIAFQTERGPFAWEGRIELEPTEAGTRVTSIIEAGPDSLSTRFANLVLGPIIRASMVRRLRSELEALSAAIEADPSIKH